MDDTAFMRMMTKKALVQSGYSDFVEAQGGAEAVKKYGGEKPDMVIMDITMPSMGGLQALKKTKESDASTKIVVCMAMRQESMVVDAIKSGAKDFIVEPFDAKRIVQIVNPILGEQPSGGLEMTFLSSFDICTSDMSTQRARMDIAAENITHINTTRTEVGGPYRRKDALSEDSGAGSSRETIRSVAVGNGFTSRHAGVRVSGVIEDDRGVKWVYSPGHPDAGVEGYVNMSNVDLLKGTVDSMSATGSHETSVTTLDATKLTAQKALNIEK